MYLFNLSADRTDRYVYEITSYRKYVLSLKNLKPHALSFILVQGKCSVLISYWHSSASLELLSLHTLCMQFGIIIIVDVL